MGNRNKTDQDFHDNVVSEIARIRFPYPSNEHSQWQTYINHPERQMGIRNGDRTLYPDIVVVDTDRNIAVMSGEIETEQSVTVAEAQQWMEYARLCDLYLYLPQTYNQKAKQLSVNSNIRGYRVYAIDRIGHIVVNNC